MKRGDAAAELTDEALRVIGLLADEERVRVFSAVALGHRGLEDIAQATGMELRSTGRALARLVSGGLLSQDREAGYRVSLGELKELSRLAAEHRGKDIEAPPEQATILRAFFKGNRLTSIPMNRSKRVVVLDHLAQKFEPGRRYAEHEVNAILSRHHDDYATLRRYLVDEEFLTRERGEYWRSGGTVDID